MLPAIPAMPAAVAPVEPGRELVDRNRRFYDALWSDARLVEPQRFNTWPLVRSLLTASQRRLEVAPGLRPRLPIEETQFVDISRPALATLHARGARAALGGVTRLPFADGVFDLVCAFDVIEHVDDGRAALAELSRVARAGATLLISTPLHPSRWTVFDDLVGHRRRYEPAALLAELADHGFTVERSAAFGMQPKSSRLVDFGMWWLTRHPDTAMRWYNRLFMPLALRFQKPLLFEAGLIATDRVDEIVLVCRRLERRR